MDIYLNTFLIQNGLKQGDALLSLIFKFASDYAIRKDKLSHVALKLNETHQLLVWSKFR
jgi:hypothetical protein